MLVTGRNPGKFPRKSSVKIDRQKDVLLYAEGLVEVSFVSEVD